MNFVVEDGSGDPDANAYATVEFVTTYHADRGHFDWVGSSNRKQQAIVAATDYLDKRFGTRFRGSRRNRDQALQWPRIGATDNSGYDFPDIPKQLKQACAEYALRVLTLGELAPDPSEGEEGEITGKREKVGPIEEEVTYAEGVSRSTLTSLVSSGSLLEYPAADLLLEELIKSSSNRRIVRG